MDFPSLPIEPPYKVDSPFFCDMFPKHIERMRYNKRREQTVNETIETYKNVNPRFIDFLQGHSQKGMGGNVYMKGITIDVLLNECVEKINWDVEWEKLKVKW